MYAQYVPCIIFSVDKPDKRAGELITDRTWIEDVLKRLEVPHEKLIGCYQGNTEMSFMVTDLKWLEMIKGIAKEYDQDSILVRDNENRCTLVFFDGRLDLNIGTLENVSQQEAMSHECYTFSPKLNRYFVCK